MNKDKIYLLILFCICMQLVCLLWGTFDRTILPLIFNVSFGLLAIAFIIVNLSRRK
jgi:hypothetical protein